MFEIVKYGWLKDTKETLTHGRNFNKNLPT